MDTQPIETNVPITITFDIPYKAEIRADGFGVSAFGISGIDKTIQLLSGIQSLCDAHGIKANIVSEKPSNVIKQKTIKHMRADGRIFNIPVGQGFEEFIASIISDRKKKVSAAGEIDTKASDSPNVEKDKCSCNVLTVEELTQENLKLTNMLDADNKTIEQQENTIKTLTYDNHVWARTCDKYLELAKRSSDTNDKLVSKLNETRARLEEVRLVADTWQNEAKDLQRSLEFVNKNALELESESKYREAECERLIKNYVNEIADLKQEAENMKSDYGAIEALNKGYAKEVETLRKANEWLANANYSLQNLPKYVGPSEPNIGKVKEYPVSKPVREMALEYVKETIDNYHPVTKVLKEACDVLATFYDSSEATTQWKINHFQLINRIKSLLGEKE